MFGHAALAGAVKSPLLNIDATEAEKLATAIDNVLSHYVNVTVDPKTRDWIALIFVAGQVYGPRIVAAGLQKKQNAAPKAPEPAALKPDADGMVTTHIHGIGDVKVPMQ